MGTNEIKVFKENVLKIKLLGGKLIPIEDNYTMASIQCIKDWVKNVKTSICLSNISNKSKFTFNHVICEEIYTHCINNKIKPDVIVLNNTYDYNIYDKCNIFNRDFHIEYISSNTLYSSNTNNRKVTYIEQTENELIDSMNLLTQMEGIFSTTYSFACAIKKAQLPTSKNKNIIVQI